MRTIKLAFVVLCFLIFVMPSAIAQEAEPQPIDLPYGLPSVGVSTALGILALFLTQALKQALDESKHRYIPLGLILLLPAIGLGLAAGTGNLDGPGLVQGALEGVVAAWAAVYGYQLQKGLRGQ